ncbi:hypothetical protein [Streptomyces parvus]|uniref:Uncharacterized protein n=1 Tax=Streptomyces parvus TaxID=66428 RepID=A0A5D4JDH8_9ACTN|nr:hypothetical protein [Streptomyces parvus]TYR63188.1 hypothetical protein FY004_17985 [Streptomyces parvus]
MKRCDLCGVLLPGESVPSAVVRDSSSLAAHDPGQDGVRRVSACSPEHLAVLVERYQRRPFVDAELWAGKIARSQEQHPGKNGVQALCEDTGLTPAHVEKGLQWICASCEPESQRGPEEG